MSSKPTPPPVPDRSLELLTDTLCYHLADALGSDDAPANLRRHIRRALTEMRDVGFARGRAEGGKLGVELGRKRGAQDGYQAGFDRGFAEGRSSVHDDDTQPSKVPTRRAFPPP